MRARAPLSVALAAPLLAMIACSSEPRFVAHAPLASRAAPVCPLGGCKDASRAATPAGSAAIHATCAAPGACDAPPERACDESDPKPCTDRALDLWSAGGDAVLARAYALFDRGCTLGDVRGCHFAGRLAFDGHGVPKDRARGLALLEKACDGGVIASCDVLARALAPHGKSTSDDDDDDEDARGGAKRFALEGECLRGVANSCFYAGFYFERGANHFPKDYARGVTWYARGCDLSEVVSCNNLGNDYYYGDGVKQDFEHAAHYYGKACAGAEPVGCANVGFITEYGDGATRDMKRALELYMTGCSGGSTYACLHVSMMEEYRAGTPHDPALAVAKWKRECEAKNAKACAYLGVMHEDGKGTPRDERKALELMKRACDMRPKDERGCKWVREHAI